MFLDFLFKINSMNAEIVQVQLVRVFCFCNYSQHAYLFFCSFDRRNSNSSNNEDNDDDNENDNDNENNIETVGVCGGGDNER